MRFLVAADGINVRFWVNPKRRKRGAGSKPAEEEERQGGIIKREVKTGVIALLNRAGKVVRGSQWYTAAWSGAANFRVHLAKTAEARGIRPMDEVAVLSDGAKWLRALATRHFDTATAIRDFFHAVEHQGVMGEALYGEGDPRAAAWQAAMARRLKREGAAPLVAEWESMDLEPKDRKTWERELAYFRTQQAAMAYGEFREKNLPIGSGSAEGGCKSVVGERFKVTGARWTEDGLNNLMALRVRYCNGVPIIPKPGLR